MSDVVSRGPTDQTSHEDRIIAGLNYGLLFLTPFFGITPLIAAVLAYVRRNSADPLLKSHYSFQIRMFWIGLFVLVAATVAAFLGAGVLIAHLFEARARGGEGWDSWDVVFGGGSGAGLNVAALIILALSVLASVGAVLWVMLASVFGVARLLSSEPIGRLK